MLFPSIDFAVFLPIVFLLYWFVFRKLAAQIDQPIAALIADLKQLAKAATPKPTNVIVLFVDDMGYADIGPFGNKTLRTPHLDRFAKEGMRFTSFYATPVCSMSRASRL